MRGHTRRRFIQKAKVRVWLPKPLQFRDVSCRRVTAVLPTDRIVGEDQLVPMFFRVVQIALKCL